MPGSPAGRMLRLDQLEVRLPRLRARLPAQVAASPAVQIDNLLIQARGRLTPEGPQATLHRLRLRLQALELPRLDLDLAARLTPQYIELTRFVTRSRQSELRGRGRLITATQDLQFWFDLPAVQLDEFVRPWPATWPSQTRGRLEVQGTLHQPQLKARLQYATAELTAY